MNSNQAKVTWLLPVKNGMPYILETLASIEAQTYKNWEILAWDNASDDGTLELLQEWIPARLPGKIVSDNPLPLVKCLDEMIRMTETEYCARIDADDINLPTRLEKQVAFLEANPQVGAVGSNVQSIDPQGAETVSIGHFWKSHDDIIHKMMVQNPLAHPAVTLRRSVALQAGNYAQTNALCAEDYDLWMRMAKISKLSNLEEKLLRYRVHPNSKTNVEKKQNVLTGAINSLFASNASDLYGISPEDAIALREKKKSPSLPLLWKIATHLSKAHGGSPMKRMRSKTFIDAGQQLTASNDYLTRAVLKVFKTVG